MHDSCLPSSSSSKTCNSSGIRIRDAWLLLLEVKKTIIILINWIQCQDSSTIEKALPRKACLTLQPWTNNNSNFQTRRTTCPIGWCLKRETRRPYSKATWTGRGKMSGSWASFNKNSTKLILTKMGYWRSRRWRGFWFNKQMDRLTPSWLWIYSERLMSTRTIKYLLRSSSMHITRSKEISRTEYRVSAVNYWPTKRLKIRSWRN